MNGQNLTEEVMRVWGEYDDFDSLDYIGWIIEGEAQEIRESNWDEAEKEFADIAICALRSIAENNSDPETVVRERLKERMDGNQEEIIKRDKARYSREVGNA